MRVQGSGGEEGGWGAADTYCTGWKVANNKSEREVGGDEGRERKGREGSNREGKEGVEGGWDGSSEK